MDFVELCSIVVDQVGLNMAASQNIKLGVIYGTISALSTASMGVFVKMIGQTLPTSMLIFWHVVITLIVRSAAAMPAVRKDGVSEGSK